MNIDPAAVLAVISEQALRIATMDQRIAELESELAECEKTPEGQTPKSYKRPSS